MIVYSLIGKGGVGKTLSASMLAALAAERGKTLVISLDPAHNLGDTLGVELSPEPKEIYHNLFAAEPDIDSEIRNFSKSIVEELKSHYKYLKAFNLDKMIDILEYMPGVEEQVLFDLFVKYTREDYEYLIIDHPPTGLALRVLLYPDLMLNWTSRLYEMRKEIIRRRRALAKMEGKQELEGDPVLEILESELRKLEGIRKLIKSSDLHRVGLVLNPEELPFLEAKRALHTLRKFGIDVSFSIINKVLPPESGLAQHQKKWLEMTREVFPRVIEVPFVYPPPKGISEIREMARRFIGDLP